MKVEREAIQQHVVSKKGTVVGEVYTSVNAKQVVFRTKGGFAYLESGEWLSFATTREDALFIHEPTAKVVIGA